ncbi:MAG TPA: NADH:flavin oxidoreductase/NADH oxidase [Gemmatimonadales bacterium]|nr:NADH:flavin oxidoreductase/NADH oxidase [Gemmatimonadales bacterium]
MASRLFSPVTLRRVSLPNRIVVSPMCQYSAQDGRATDWHLMHLGGLALSGAGLLFIEATAVEPDGRITPSDLGLWNDETEQALVPVLDAIRGHSSTSVGIQLAHAGRKASCRVPWEGGAQLSMAEGGWQTVAPSAVPHNEGERPPKALNVADLARIRDAFAASAQRAVRLGIDGIELHAAHGYLLHEFLSPISNRRTDAYGGSLDRRLRFPLEVFDAVRAVVPTDMPVGVRVSATDWVEGGWDLEQTIAFAEALRSRGADWITASSGGISPLQQIALGPGYQVPFAEAIRGRSGLATIAVGLITEPKHAEAIVAGGQADMVALARGLLYDPRWGWHAAAALGATVDAPPQYWRAPPREQSAVFRRQLRPV